MQVIVKIVKSSGSHGMDPFAATIPSESWMQGGG